MLKIINHGIEMLLDPETHTPYETEYYTLSSRRKVVWEYKSQTWKDRHNREYTAVFIGSIVGFNRKNTLSKSDKEILSQSPEGKAYVAYNEKIGGDNIGLNVPWGYPPRIQEYLDKGHTVEEIYRDCIKEGISWEEMFSCYIDSSPDITDCYVVEISW